MQKGPITTYSSLRIKDDNPWDSGSGFYTLQVDSNKLDEIYTDDCNLVCTPDTGELKFFSTTLDGEGNRTQKWHTVALVGTHLDTRDVGDPPVGDLSDITLTGVITGNSDEDGLIETSVGDLSLNMLNKAAGNYSMGGNLLRDLPFPENGSDAASKDWVLSVVTSEGTSITLSGAVTGTSDTNGNIATVLTPITVSQISDFNSAVVANSLDSFAAPTSNISFNNNRLIQLSDPVDPTDGVNLRTLEDAIDAATSSPITVTGAVTGTSDANGNIATTLTPITTSQITNYTSATQALINATPISSLAAANANINLDTFSISSSATPTTGNNLGNKTYIDSTSSSAATTAVNNRTTTLTGAVTGTGTGNTINTILTNITPSQVTGFDAQVRTNRLDQMALPTANMDFNGKLLNNVATPLSTNTNAVATVGYVNGAVSAGGTTTTLTGAVTGSGIGTIATTLTPITVSQITNYTSATQALINATPISSLAAATADINLGTFRISSSTAPTTGNHLGNKTYIDNTSSSAATTAVNNRTTTLTGAVTGTGTGNTINTTLTPITASQITNYITSTQSLINATPISSLAAATADINLGTFRISSSATPTTGNNLGNKTYIDSTSSSVATTAVNNRTTTLTGAVTGTGTGNTINTTLTPITVSQITNYTTSTQSLINATPISSLAAANANINLGTFSISSSTTPTTGNHLGNKTYIDSTSSSAATTAVNNRTTTLTGAVTGTGTGNTINTVLTNITPSQVTGFDAQVRTSRLDQMALPTANMDFNGKLLNNVGTPLSTNTNAAATVGYVNGVVAAGGTTITLTGAVTGTGTGTINTTLTPITVSQITNYTTSTQSLINATPISSLAAATTDINLGTFRISSSATPTANSNLVNKFYIDSTYGSFREQASLVVDNNTVSQSFTANTATKLSLSLTGFNVASTVFSFNSANSRFICTPPATTSGMGFNTEVIMNFTSSNVGAHDVTAQIVQNGAVGSLKPVQTIRCLGNNASEQIYISLPQSYTMLTNDYLEIYLTFSAATTLVVRNLVWNIRGR